MTRQGRRPSSGAGSRLGHDDASLPDACGLSPARDASVCRDQASEGHLVDALALRGDEGRSTLR